jgi:hypothetical protein
MLRDEKCWCTQRLSLYMVGRMVWDETVLKHTPDTISLGPELGGNTRASYKMSSVRS